MANIPVGTKLQITEYIPLPVERPDFTKLLDFTPYVPVQGLDLPKIGVDWLLQPWDWFKLKVEEGINLMEDVYTNPDRYSDIFYFLLTSAGIATVAVLTYCLLRYVFKKIKFW